MEGRTLDKRKARDKDTDSENSDTTLNKNPTKRARVDYSNNSSSSPKEKSPSPGSAQKSPVAKASLTDSFTAATPAPTLSPGKGENNNGNASMVAGSSTVNNNDSPPPAPVISKFELPSPFTTQELEQKIGKSKDQKEDSDSENEKFLSQFIESEEHKKKGQKGGSPSASSPSVVGPRSNGTVTTPTSNSRRSAGTSTNSKPNSSGRAVHQPLITSSPVQDLVNDNHELEVTIKICDPTNRQIFLAETVFRSDANRVDAFLKQHSLKLTPPSHSQSSSGYLGDISSSEQSSCSSVQNSLKSSQSSGSSRWTISSLGSTIPRQSIVSIATDASESPDDLMKRPGKPAPVSKARKRSDGPIMSSTKVDDSSSSSSPPGRFDRMNISPNPVSNGENSHSSDKSQSSSSKNSLSAKRFKNTPSKQVKQPDLDEGIGISPSTSASPRRAKGPVKASTSTPVAAQSDTASGSASKPGARRRVGSANNFPITNALTPPALSAVLNTPPPARNKAKVEGSQAKPLSKFEQEMNNEAVVESQLKKSETLWSTILPQELVFARWRDKKYYSGMVMSKGLNDTWHIDYDDGMTDVASETHIVPIRILGVGVRGTYSPDDHYEAKSAVVIGQKFMVDPDTKLTAVKYAIKCDGDDVPIWCSRRQLSIQESDAKKLRPEYASIVTGKPGDVSTDNIVSGPRRRTRGETSTEDMSKKKVATGFDESSSTDEKNLESSSTSTPKGRGGSRGGGRKTPAPSTSDTKRKRSVNTNTPQAKDASTLSPAKEIPAKESPPRTSKMEPGKKKTKKNLFQGMQFFLTASGGGDPGISGTPVQPPIPYDKDEYRELIESSGGEILDTVGNEQEQKENVFLISDSYARTVKYIYCLAAGIPCLAHTWIKQCLDTVEIVEWNVFTLPAGWSIEHQDVIPTHVKKPLQGCKIFVTSESDQLYNYWKPVLTAADAVLLKPPRKKGTLIPSGTEVVVSDISDATPAIADEAKATGVPLVKPEWLVQTIITGEKAHLYGHDKYKIVITEAEDDYTEESSSEVGSNDHGVLAQMQTPD